MLHRVSLRIVTMPIQSQGIITRDNVSVDVSAVAYFRVVDAVKSVVAIENVHAAIDQIAQTTLRKVVGQHTLDETLSETDRINLDIREILDVTTVDWGVEVTLVELKDIQLPDSMKRAMARQAEAEREKRAKIINAEGESLAAAALGDASDIMMAHPLALQLRNLQSLVEIGVDKNTTVVFPAPVRHRPSAPRGDAGGRRTRTGRTPRRSARRGHIQRHRKTSPLATLKAVSAAAGVVAAQCICSASNPASVMSVTPFHWVLGPREHEGQPLLATDGGLRGQRLAHVHRVAEGVADDRVRPVHAPGEAVALGGREQLVLLRVVEVRVRQPVLVLVERRVRQVALAVRLEGTEVVLEPGQQRDVPHRSGGPDGLQDVADHRAVDPDVLRLGLLAGPGGHEDVRRPVPGEGVPHRRRR